MSTKTQRLTGKQAVQYIQSRVGINEPGKYTLQVISTNPHNGKVIVNLKAQSAEGLAKAKAHLTAGEYDDAANTNMSTSVFADASFIPAKGEYVSAMVDYVENRKGDMVLGVVSINEMRARTTTKVSLGDEFANLLDVEASADESDDNNPD